MGYRVLADCMFFLHLAVICIVLFGWLFPEIFYLYVALLVAVLASNLFLRACVLSDIEFFLRKKYDPQTSYEYSYTTFYTHKLTKQVLGDNFLRVLGIFFTATSLSAVCNSATYFLIRWCGRGESNSYLYLGKVSFYH